MEDITAPREQTPYSIIRNLTSGLTAIVGLVLIFVILVISAVSYISTREAEIRDDYGPRARLNETIRSAVVDQETAARGYLISGNPLFLESFLNNRDRYLEARAALGDYPAYDGSMGQKRLNEFEAADGWYRDIGLPAIEGVRARGGPPDDPEPTLQASREAINVFLNAYDLYQIDLEAHVDDAAGRIDDIRKVIVILTTASSIVILGATTALSWSILRAIRKPLETLGKEVAAIDAGATRHRVPALAAQEFDQLGRGINRMLDILDDAMEESDFQQRRFGTIVESANEGIVVLDAAGFVTTINPAATRMFGVAAESTIGKPATDLGLFTEQDFALGLGRVRWRGGAGQPIVRRYGDIVLSALVSPLGTSPSVLSAVTEASGWVCVIRDVTELTRIDEMKNEFISIVSHELRTPLTAIKGFTDLILEGEAGDISQAQRDFLEIVQSNSDRLVALINDMLDISRIESGRIALELDEIYVPEVINQTLTALRPLIDEKQLNVRSEIADDLPSIVGDAGRLLQILTNLVSNACKYTLAGGWITVSAEPLDGLVAVSVSDTGIGIPADALPRVFSKFYRVDQGAARAIGGTGLGLAITKSLVEMHGGRITIASRPSVGTTVRFTLPTARHPAVAEAWSEAGVMTHPIILLAAHDELARARWAAALRRIPSTVVFPRSLSIAALVAESEYHHPTVILLDAGSAVDLDELLLELSALPDLASTQIVIVGTHVNGHDERERVLVLPADTTDDQLAAVVESIVPRTSNTAPSRGRVLVAEDDLDSAHLLRRILSGHGFEVLLVHDGLSAVIRAIEMLPDIVILDVNMPKMGAIEVLPQLRGNPATRDIPIIVMSGTVPDSRPYFIEAGAADFFSKPINADALVSRLIDLRKR